MKPGDAEYDALVQKLMNGGACASFSEARRRVTLGAERAKERVTIEDKTFGAGNVEIMQAEIDRVLPKKRGWPKGVKRGPRRAKDAKD